MTSAIRRKHCVRKDISGRSPLPNSRLLTPAKKILQARARINRQRFGIRCLLVLIVKSQESAIRKKEAFMRLNERQQAVFMQRTDTWYQRLKRRAQAAGQTLDYPLADLRHYVFHNLGRHHCHYCCGPVDPGTFEIDAKIPPERGGSFNFHNMAVVCKDCGLAKGWLDHFEYRELISLLRSWAPRIRRNFIARLQAGRNIPLHLNHDGRVSGE